MQFCYIAGVWERPIVSVQHRIVLLGLVALGLALGLVLGLELGKMLARCLCFAQCEGVSFGVHIV